MCFCAIFTLIICSTLQIYILVYIYTYVSFVGIPQTTDHAVTTLERVQQRLKKNTKSLIKYDYM